MEEIYNDLTLQKFDDEHFTKINGINNLLFEDDIYISNYGDVYNNSQKKLIDYENSSIFLKILNGGIKYFSRWSLTTSVFNILNSDYEKNRKLKKIKYGYGVQNSKIIKNYCLKFNINIKNIKEEIEEEKNKEEKNKEEKIKEEKIEEEEIEEEEIEEEEIDIMINSNIKKIEFDLIKYKFMCHEITKQKNNLEKKIQNLEKIIKLSKETNKYTKTIIYIIRPKHNNFYMYVGHTIDKDRRLKEHIRLTECSNTKLYKTIRDTGGWEHWEMILLSEYDCNCKTDALKIEQLWCEKLRPNLNSLSPFS